MQMDRQMERHDKASNCFLPFCKEQKNWNANYIWDIGTPQITWHTALVQAQHRLVYMMWRYGFLLHRRTLLCQKLPAEFEKKLVTFQQHVIGHHKTKESIFWSKQEILMRTHCTLLSCQIIMGMMLGKNLWWWKHQAMNMQVFIISITLET